MNEAEKIKAQMCLARVEQDLVVMISSMGKDTLTFRKAEVPDADGMCGDEMMSMQVFRASCKSNMLTDEDGFGHYAGFIEDDPEGPHFVVSNVLAHASYVAHPLAVIPAWATDVAWHSK